MHIACMPLQKSKGYFNQFILFAQLPGYYGSVVLAYTYHHHTFTTKSKHLTPKAYLLVLFYELYYHKNKGEVCWNVHPQTGSVSQGFGVVMTVYLFLFHFQRSYSHSVVYHMYAFQEMDHE